MVVNPVFKQLLQSSARELRPLLLFIWTKILAVDVTCQADLVRDGGHKYFLAVLQDNSVPVDQRTLAAFVVSRVVWNHPAGQDAVAQVAFISNALEMVDESDRLLRQWIVIGIGLAWHNAIAARWSAIRDSAHEKLFPLLRDPVPEVCNYISQSLRICIVVLGSGSRGYGLCSRNVYSEWRKDGKK